MQLELKQNIIFEDSELLVINKPSGIVVNRALSVADITIQDWVEQYLDQNISEQNLPNWTDLIPKDFSAEFGSPESIFKNRSGIAHRLDKETSGALIIAKNPGSLVNILDQFKKREVEKSYLCLVHGKFLREMGEIDLPIARRSRDRKLMGIVPEGRPAQTNFSVKEYFPDFLPVVWDNWEKVIINSKISKKIISKMKVTYQGFSLVECWPQTGRTHQIRVHLAHLQHPLVSDMQYGGKKRAKLDQFWCPRHFLHAQSIKLKHPRSKMVLDIKVPLTPDLIMVLKNFVSRDTVFSIN